MLSQFKLQVPLLLMSFAARLFQIVSGVLFVQK